jgi:hypothetical protein
VVLQISFFQDLHHQEDFILDYPPVNELLKIREGIEQGLTAEDIVATLLGHYNKKEIEEKYYPLWRWAR